MSDRVVQPCHDRDANARKSMHLNQSAWTHRMRPSHDLAPQVRNHIFLHQESKKDHKDPKQGHVPMLVQIHEPREVTRFDVDASVGNTSEYRNGCRSKQGLEIASFVTHSAKGLGVATEGKKGEIRNQIRAMTLESMRKEKSDSQLFPTFNFDQNRESSLVPRKNPDGFAIRSQTDENHGCSTTAVQTNEPNRFFPRVLALIPSEKQYPMGKDHLRPKGIPVIPEQQVKPQISLKKNDLPVSRLNTPEELTSSCSLQKMPTCSVYGVGSMRICPTVELGPGVPPNFSQWTDRLLISKKTDVNLSKGNRMIKESVYSNFKENALHELHSPTLVLGFGQSNSEGVGDVRDAKTHGESSAETDIMDIDVFQEENHLAGIASFLSNKGVEGGQYPAKSHAAMVSPRQKVGNTKTDNEFLDKNQELPASAAASGSTDSRELSESKTESLDVEQHLSCVEQPSNPNSSPWKEGLIRLDPSSRWVKRFKLSVSDSLDHGAKILRMGEASSSEKRNSLFNKIMNYGGSSSSKRLGKGHKEFSSMDSVKGGQDIMVPYCWIKRWCHNQAAIAEVSPKSQSLKAALFGGPQRKQFTSVAAGALTAKAASGLRPCQFRKRGPLVVWNT